MCWRSRHRIDAGMPSSWDSSVRIMVVVVDVEVVGLEVVALE